MIEIIRLKNGEDIIGDVVGESHLNEEFDINDPMSVSIEFRNNESGLVMNHWLPVQIIDKNSTKIKKQDVLTRFHPNKEFSEYYRNTVERLDRLMKVKQEVDNMSDEEVSEIMDNLLDGKDKTYH
jgi:hypothetical protein